MTRDLLYDTPMSFFGKKKRRARTARKKRPARNRIYARRKSGRARTVRPEGIQHRRFSRGLSLILSLLVVAGAGLIYIAKDLPDISTLDVIKKQRGITVETEDGKILATYGDIYGHYVTYDQMPKTLIQAVIATEDRRFFAHHGVDIWGITRAMIRNLRAGRVVEGGSTITQQVAKNIFLTPERSLKRKLQEVLLAFWLESRFNKKEILAIYLNRVYLGAGAYGVDAASLRYFGKPATDLTLMESAMMAGLLKAPSRFAPTSSQERANARAYQVLLNMVDAGMLRARDAEAAIEAYKKQESSHTVEGSNVRYYTDWIVDQLPEYIGNVESDLIVTTTFVPDLQTQAQDALENVVATEGPAKNVSQGAMVAMTTDGAVRALIGGVNYSKSQFNRVTQARRQPGSAFKLFVYLAALEAGMTPESLVEDAPVTMQVGNTVWSPENYSRDYKGFIPMVQALRESLNTVSVRLSQFAGIWRVAQMAKRLGISDIPSNPSIALGASEVTLLDLTAAYGHLANQGYSVKPYGILRIRTQQGETVYLREGDRPQPVLANGTVQMMNYMLLDVVRRGTGTRAAIGRDAAGKTGTSQEFKDAWFIGFTPQLITGVWVGNDNNQSMKKVTGGSLPAMIWHDFMIAALKGIPPEPIPNQSESKEGLFPWLFGGTMTTPEPPPVASQPLPENAPFAIQGDGDLGVSATMEPEPTGPMILELPMPDMPPEAVREAQPPSEEPDDLLTPDFWKKLGEKMPEKKVEYSYPGDNRR